MAEQAIASAYVSIIPSMKGFNNTLTNELTRSGGVAGDKAGVAISGGIKKSMMPGLKGIGVGLLATMGIGAAIDGLQKSLESLGRIEVINKQTETVIKSMGNQAGISAKEVEALAGALEATTATEAESIQEGANLLLTFGNIKNAAGEGNDIFNQTTKVMVDMARAMGTDAKSGAIQLGKALNDPIGGIAALSRVGIQFSDEQKAMIQGMVESGDTMGAQKVILAELQKQFGGSGAAYAETFQGKMDLMNHAIGTIGESIMTSMLPILEDMVSVINSDVLPAVQSFIEDFKKGETPLNDFFKIVSDTFNFIKDNWTWISIVGGAIAGLAIVLGIATLAMNIATVATWAFNAAWLANPITWIVLAIVAAIALVIVIIVALATHWDEIMKFMGESITNIGNFFTDVFTNIGNFFMTVFGAIGSFFSSLWTGIVNNFKASVNFIISIFEGMINFIIGGINGFLKLINMALGAIKQVTGFDVRIRTIGNVKLPRLAKGGFVDQPTTALIGEAGPEVVTPLKDFERMMGIGDNNNQQPVTVNLTVNPAPGMSETELAKTVVKQLRKEMRR